MLRVFAGLLAVAVFLACPLGVITRSEVMLLAYLCFAMPAGAAGLWAFRYARNA
jgi:hypothetical protein